LILKYPTYASEEILQKIRKKTTDQTIKENNKLNTNLDKNNLEEVDVPSKKIDLDFNLKQKARFVKKGIHVQNIDNVMLREMLHKKFITMEEYKSY
jgi:hypothetical protein